MFRFLYNHPQAILRSKKGFVFLKGPEDGSIRTETRRPNTTINIMKLLCLTDTSL